MDHYRLAASGERDGLWDWDLVSNRVHFSPRWASMVGCEDGEVGSSPEEWLRRVHPEDQQRVRRAIEAHQASDADGFEIRHRMRHRDGTYSWMACRGAVVRDGSGVALRLVGSHADVTADHVDALTGLPNRELFVDRVNRSIQRSQRNPGFLYAVLVIDLDRPASEETARQADNDPLLTTSARRIEACLRGTEQAPFPGDDYLVARLRGSQLAVLLEGLGRTGEARVAAERLLAALVAPLQARGRQVFPRASLGIAVSATGYTVPEDVLRDADAALYRARTLGGNRCEVFDTESVQRAETRFELEADLGRAVEEGQLLLFYQPVVEAASSRIVGLEALARWQHPTRGTIPPHEFIPIAEETGLIVALEQWTLREACRQLAAWRTSLPPAKDLWVSVNVSGAHLRHPGILERVGRALHDTGLDPASLVLELTEGVVIEDPAAVRTLLMQLRVMGVRIGIDDFGTGHSSFAYLHQFPADFLKVDQSLVRGMELRQDKADIVGAVVGLAAQLGLRVIAEGIESEAGLRLVRSRRCEYLQGFLFSKPLSAGAATELLRTGAPLLEVPPEPAARADSPAATTHRARRAGLAMAALLASVGLMGRLTGEPTAPTPPATPRPTATAPAIAAPTPSPSSAAATAPARNPAPARPAAAAVAPRAVVALAMEHQHVFGSCRGVLRVSRSGVSFAGDNGKDVFAFKYGRFQSARGRDTLTITDGQRTYRFRAVARGETGGSPSQLAKVASAIGDFQRK